MQNYSFFDAIFLMKILIELRLTLFFSAIDTEATTVLPKLIQKSITIISDERELMSNELLESSCMILYKWVDA